MDPGTPDGTARGEPSADVPGPEPLGPLATALWTAVVVLVFLGTQIAAAVALGGFDDGRPSGTTIGITVLIAVVPALALLGFAAARRAPAAHYLALDRPAAGVVVRWLLPFLALIGLVDLASWALDQPVVPDEVLQMVSSARPAWPLVLAVLVAAPLFEELLFRGLLYRGAAATRLGPVGASVLCAALWAALHLHYAAYHVALIALYGVVLGVARWRTGSTSVAIALHAAANLVALLQARVVLG